MFFLAAVLCAIATGFEITFDEFSLFKLAIGTMAVVVFAGFGALLHNVGDQRSIEAQVFSVHN